MKIKNTTDYSDRFLRRMVAWCCKQLELPASHVRAASFRNARHAYGGLAYLRQRRIGVTVGKPAVTDKTIEHHEFRDGFRVVTHSRMEVLLVTTAHELAHLDLYRRGNKSRGNGRGSGGSERLTEGLAAMVLEMFRKNSEALLAEWNATAEPAAAPKPKPSIQDRRAEKAQKLLEKWQRKFKLAQSKLRQYHRRVAYYEKSLAAKRGG